jgi:hypothetical protein
MENFPMGNKTQLVLEGTAVNVENVQGTLTATRTNGRAFNKRDATRVQGVKGVTSAKADGKTLTFGVETGADPDGVAAEVDKVLA